MQSFKIKFYKKIPLRLEEIANQQKKIAYQSIYSFNNQQLSERQDKSSSQNDCFGFLLIFDGRMLIGGLKLFKRKLNLHSSKAVLGGIGGVWVKVDKQRLGVGSALVDEAMQILEANNCDIAFLCTDIKRLGGFYKRVGFKWLKRGYTFLGKSGKRYYDYDGMVATVKSPEVFTKILHSKKSFDIGIGNW
jgi:GNAT superfamily N-acetyltransferase